MSTADSKTSSPRLHRSLTTVEYFAFGFGSMVGVGWLLLMDDWLGRGGPLGAMLGFLAGGLLLVPVAHIYGNLVRRIPDAGAEIAYTEGVFPSSLAFATGWTMVLAYAIVCPWEAVAIGNLLARVFPAFNSYPLYALAGKVIYAPRLAAGVLLTMVIAGVNYRGIRPSGVFQDVMTFGLLAIFAIFALLGFARGEARNLQPLFAAPGAAGALLSVILVLQVVPYFMTGFESVAKGSEEARAGFDPRNFGRAINLALLAGAFFYVVVIAVVSFVFPWRTLVAQRLGSEVAFERAFGSPAIARLILVAAFLSLLKIFNGNFVAATRLLLGIGRRGLVHPALARVHPVSGTPSVAIGLVAGLTLVGACLGDALLVPVTEVGSLAVGVGWLSACLAYAGRARRGQMNDARGDAPRLGAVYLASAVSVAIIGMKVVPWVPGSFTGAEWFAFALWAGLGLLFWAARAAPQDREREP
jgi:APA family basic amino acid/polyamine antiporter